MILRSRGRWGAALAAGVVWVISPACSVWDDRPEAPPSRDAPLVRGDDVAALWTVPALPMLDLGVRVRTAGCRRAGTAPGRGGRWYFWRCVVQTPRGRRSVDVMWQIDDPRDAPVVPVEARTRSGRRVTGCCIADPLKSSARDVARLFTEPYRARLLAGDGVNSAGCRPGRDPSGLGNPWRCTLETDSEGTMHRSVRVYADGRFAAGYAGRGCCVDVR